MAGFDFSWAHALYPCLPDSHEAGANADSAEQGLLHNPILCYADVLSATECRATTACSGVAMCFGYDHAAGSGKAQQSSVVTGL